MASPVPAIRGGSVLTWSNLTTSALGTITFAGATNQSQAVIDDGTKVLGVWFQGVASATASTSNFTGVVEFSPDGTNWLTSGAKTVTFPLTGTTPVSFATNFAVADTANMARARLRSLTTTATNILYVTNITFLR